MQIDSACDQRSPPIERRDVRGRTRRKIAENTEKFGGGLVEIGGEQIVIRPNSRITDPAQIVAEVSIGHSFRTGASTVNGGEGLIRAARPSGWQAKTPA